MSNCSGSSTNWQRSSGVAPKKEYFEVRDYDGVQILEIPQ
jgi:hypothetical protein